MDSSSNALYAQLIGYTSKGYGRLEDLVEGSRPLDGLVSKCAAWSRVLLSDVTSRK